MKSAIQVEDIGGGRVASGTVGLDVVEAGREEVLGFQTLLQAALGLNLNCSTSCLWTADHTNLFLGVSGSPFTK